MPAAWAPQGPVRHLLRLFLETISRWHQPASPFGLIAKAQHCENEGVNFKDTEIERRQPRGSACSRSATYELGLSSAGRMSGDGFK